MPRTLAHVTIVPEAGSYRLQLALENGDMIDILASFEQLDLLAEEIDRRLDMDDERETMAGR